MKEKAKSKELTPEEMMKMESTMESAKELEIEKFNRYEEKNRRIDISGTIKSTKERIKNFELSEESQLSSGGIGRWMSIVDKHDLTFKSHLWIPRPASYFKNRNDLIDSRDSLLANPEGLTDADLKIILNGIEPTIEWLERKIEESKPKETPLYLTEEPISEDSLIKITINCEMEKLHGLFSDLVKERYLAEFTHTDLINHFTGSSRKQVVPDGAKLINWTGRKYMLVHTLRRLKGSDWFSQTHNELESHFLVNGKTFFTKKHSLKPSEKGKVNKIDEILKLYL